MSDRGWEDRRIPLAFRRQLAVEHNTHMAEMAAAAREQATTHAARRHLPQAAQSREDAAVFDSLIVPVPVGVL